jgi:hypothetical protein
MFWFRSAGVPIINMLTHYGFECDIALGGHNGTGKEKAFFLITTLLQSFFLIPIYCLSDC